MYLVTTDDGNEYQTEKFSQELMSACDSGACEIFLSDGNTFQRWNGAEFVEVEKK